MDVILAIDQGTTNTKVLMVNRNGEIIHRVSKPVNIHFPQSGWVEQKPLEIWDSVVESIKQCIDETGAVKLLGITITNQRESAMIWDRHNSRPEGPLVGWQCRRSAPFCQELRDLGLENEIRNTTGLIIDPMFSAGKIRWLLHNVPDGMKRAQNGELCAGTVDSWLLWKLTGKIHTCDVTNASRTQLMNLKSLKWDDRMMDIYDIPRQILPDIISSSSIAGVTEGNIGIPDGIPIASMIGDSHAALFGQGGYQESSLKATYGTGSSVMSPTNELFIGSRNLSATVAWGMEDDVVYALEGNITSTGATIQWLSDLIGMDNAGDSAKLALDVEHSDGVYIVPAFAGLGAPYWNEKARGLVTGLTRGSTVSHIARAAVESIAYQIRDVFDLIESETSRTLGVLLADGGGSRNDMLMQFQADILNRPVFRNNASEIASLGAAYLGGLALGVWNNLDEIASLARSYDEFRPQMNEDMRAAKYQGWKKAVARAIYEPDLFG